MKRIIIVNKYEPDSDDYQDPYKTANLFGNEIDTFRKDERFREYIMDEASRTGILILHHYPFKGFEDLKGVLKDPFARLSVENFIGKLIVRCITKKPITMQIDPIIPQFFDTFLRLSNKCVECRPFLIEGHPKTIDMYDPDRIIKEMSNKSDSMTYNYKIGYYSHEESDYVELQHEIKFSDNELTEMLAEATVDIITKMKKRIRYIHNFQDAFESEDPSLIRYLIEKFGFKLIDHELCWSAFGWASVFDKSDWKGDRDDHLDKITDIVNRTGFTRKDDDCLRRDDEIKGNRKT